jgi:flagellar hook-basal body complex protein FliE
LEPISKITSLPIGLDAVEPNTNVNPPEPPPLDFKRVFKESVREVNGLNTQAQTMVEALATGQTNDVSGVMLAVKKANLAFTSILQIRNQMVEAYQEIMRMRV